MLQGVQFYSFFLSLLLCFVVFLLVDCPSFHYYNPPKLRHQTLAATLGQQNGHQQQEGKSEPLSRKRIRHAEKHLAPPPKIKPKINNKKNPNKQQQNTDYLSLRKSKREKAKKKKNYQNIQDKVILTFLLKDYNLAKSVIGRLLPKHIGNLRICILSEGNVSPHKNENRII